MKRWLSLLAPLVFSLAPSLAAQSTKHPAQELVLSYFRDVLDGAKEELIDGMFLSDCAIHRPEGELKRNRRSSPNACSQANQFHYDEFSGSRYLRSGRSRCGPPHSQGRRKGVLPIPDRY